MFKSLDSIASVVGIFMYLTISKFKQVLRSRKGLNYNTAGNLRKKKKDLLCSGCGFPDGSGFKQKLNTRSMISSLLPFFPRSSHWQISFSPSIVYLQD